MDDSQLPIPASERVFLTAEWRNLVMLNFAVDPLLLAPFLPAGTQLDDWNGKTFISLVGFLFLKTKVLGVRIPFHRDFEEVNLRFYVRRQFGDEIRRGVVFIKEILPRWAIAFAARALYGENYVRSPMAHRIERDAAGHLLAEYGWKNGAVQHSMSALAEAEPALPQDGSEEQFITEHYWGYATQRDGGCVEYHVAHPPWRVWKARNGSVEGDLTVALRREIRGSAQGHGGFGFHGGRLGSRRLLG